MPKPIKVKSAFLQSPAGTPKFNESSINQDKLPGAKILWDAENYCLWIEWKDSKVMTPLANVRFAIMMTEDEKK